MPETKVEKNAAAVQDRAVWTTRKHRAEDLMFGDVVRNRFGKWDVVTDVGTHADGHYVTVHFEVGGTSDLRTVALVDVQVTKPS